MSSRLLNGTIGRFVGCESPQAAKCGVNVNRLPFGTARIFGLSGRREDLRRAFAQSARCASNSHRRRAGSSALRVATLLQSRFQDRHVVVGRETRPVVKRCGHVLRSHARAIIF
jgi:hypothetical protein